MNDNQRIRAPIKWEINSALSRTESANVSHTALPHAGVRIEADISEL